MGGGWKSPGLLRAHYLKGDRQIPNPMREALNRNIPFDAIARWWYLLALGPPMGLLFSLVTGLKPFRPILEKVKVVGDAPSEAATETIALQHAGWKDDLLFTVIGFLLACGLIWLLEEIRNYNQRKS
jgi:hypothetical protein